MEIPNWAATEKIIRSVLWTVLDEDGVGNAVSLDEDGAGDAPVLILVGYKGKQRSEGDCETRLD